MYRKKTVPIILIIVWLAIVGWQVVEHARVKNSAYTSLMNRAQDITNSLATVIRSQRFRGGVIFLDRLEPALQDLIKLEGLHSIVLLNTLGEVVASAGTAMKYDVNKPVQWEDETVTFVNPVDLGIDPQETDRKEPPTLILQAPERGERGPGQGQGLGPGPMQGPEPIPIPGNFPNQDPAFGPRPGPGPRPEEEHPPSGVVFHMINKNATSVARDLMRMATGVGISEPNPDRRGDWDRRRRPPRFFDRPPWMPESQYQTLVQKQGLHGFVLVLSTLEYNFSLDKDLWIRTIIGGFSLLAMVGIWVAWRNVIKSSELQLRLVRASEMNVHLREMNVAAAGLAHETRNPLNVVRGLAQMIVKQSNLPEDIRERSGKIMEEVDRVTSQLNEFIDYSKPREPKRAPVILNSVVTDVERALRSDLDDKAIQFQITGPEITMDADESLFRQVVFNLLLNSIQSVETEGKIEIRINRQSPVEAIFEISDNGPGVPFENKDRIFQPYFTTHEDGTGLGLAVVRQIVLSHGWNIEYIQNEQRGAMFQITGLKITAKVPE